MSLLVQLAVSLLAMAGLMAASAFFSASEAALFYLSHRDRRRLAEGNRAQRTAAALLADSDRLLSAVLFLNLVTNTAFFAVSSVASIHLKRQGHPAGAGALAAGSVLALIVFSELVPKSLAVLRPRLVSAWVAIPLAGLVRLVDPLLPAFRLVTLLSRRIVWPGFQPEPYLRVGDLERAVQLSTADAGRLAQEQKVLQNLVLLSEIRADELMRPRTHLRLFRAPVSLKDLQGQVPRSGYLLLSEPDSDDVAAAVPLAKLRSIPNERLDQYAQPVVYVPWCTTVAQSLELMRRLGREVAAVVNEFGETIGVLTLDDIVQSVFSPQFSRSERLLRRAPIRPLAPGVWQVTGMTSLRRLVRHFGVPRPPSHSRTVAGVVQEKLERMPQVGDECRWGPFHFKVIDVPERGLLLAELRLVQARAEDDA